jgi:hypothetical protein
LNYNKIQEWSISDLKKETVNQYQKHEYLSIGYHTCVIELYRRGYDVSLELKIKKISKKGK